MLILSQLQVCLQFHIVFRFKIIIYLKRRLAYINNTFNSQYSNIYIVCENTTLEYTFSSIQSTLDKVFLYQAGQASDSKVACKSGIDDGVNFAPLLYDA